MRWVMRSPFSKPPVEISLPVGGMSLSANPTSITAGQSTTVTADFLHDSANNAISPTNLGALIGLPVNWAATGGSLSGQGGGIVLKDGGPGDAPHDRQA